MKLTGPSLTTRGVRSRRRMLLLAVAGINLGMCLTTRAATLAWDASGSSASPGGTGNWNLTSPLWTANGSTFSNWVNGSVAVFNSVAGTVTTASALTAGGLTFNAAYTLTGSSVLTLNGSSIAINTNGVNVLDSMAANTLALASGSTTINKTGVGVLTMVNDQSSSIPANSTWNISGGTLNATTGIYSSGVALGDGKELGSSTGFTLILNGGSLSFTASGGAGLYTARTVSISAAGGSISDGGFAPGEGTAGGNTISPVVSISAGNGLNLVANDILEFDNNGGAAGVISGAGGITIYGKGAAEILSTANTYTGGTTINSGSTLVIGGANSIGSGNLTVNGTLNLSSASLSVKAFASNSGTINFNLSSGGTVNKITATSASMTGTTLIGIGIGSSSTLAVGSYPVITTTSGTGLSGALAFSEAGDNNISIPINAEITTVGGTAYRLTLASTGSSVNLVASPAPAHAVSIMPLGSSITAGYSVASPYNGGGYMSQLYQHLVNDGRFTPTFVGSSNANEAVNPTGPALTTTVGQTANEGHPGYTTVNLLANLNGNDGSGGNDNGYWLAPTNNVNPNIITLNIGGNDFADGIQGATGSLPIGRLDQILTEIYTLRPNATIIVSSLLYRGDGSPAGVAATGPTGFDTAYNPLIPGLVYQHVLAGQHVSFVDMGSIITPNNSLALIGPDAVHPTQAGYNAMGDAWYTAITTGQAFYTGNAGAAWNSTGSNGTTNWDMDLQRTIDSGVAPSSGTDVYFNGIGGVTALGANTSVRSVNFAANVSGGTTPSVTITGPYALTLGMGGITNQTGTGVNLIAAPVVVGASQNWSNVATTPFWVTGNISGSLPLTIGGTGVMVLSGNNSGFSGQTNLSSGILNLSNINALQGSTLNLLAGGVVFDQSVAGDAYTIGGLMGGTPIVLNNNAASPASIALTVGGNNASTIYSGQIGGTGSLIKIGTGTLTLTSGGTGITGNYNFSGGLTINGGTVATTTTAALGVGGNGGYASTVTVTLNGGELDFVNAANTLVSTATLNLGSGNGSIGILLNATTWNVAAAVVGPGMLMKKGAGTLLFSGTANSYSGGTTVLAGTLTGANANAFGGGGISLANATTLALGVGSGINIVNPVSIAPGAVATLQLGPGTSFSSGGVGAIAVGSGGTAVVAASMPNGILKTPSITFASNGSGWLNVGVYDLDVTSQSLGAVNALVASGYAGGNWTGAGINSAAAAVDTTHLTALGVIVNNIGGTTPLYGINGSLASTFDTATPAAGDVLVKYTWYGDTNLDGKVDGGDYSRIDAAFGTSLTGWYNGDFNFDGKINGSDFTLMDNAFNSQGAAIAAQVAGVAGATALVSASDAVPEPAGIVFCVAGTVSLLGRRLKK